MSFFKKIFSKKTAVLSFTDEIRNEIFQCEQKIFEYEKDIHNIKAYARDLIHKTFKVPEKFWYEELKHLDEIIEINKDKITDKEALDDIRNICLSYKKQTDLRKMKIELCVKNKAELNNMLKDEENIRKNLSAETNKEAIIEKHKLNTHIINTDITDEVVSSSKVQILREQIDEMREELMLKKEFNKQLQILYSKYGTSTNFDTVKVYHDELKELINGK